jgi:hypothetical protein
VYVYHAADCAAGAKKVGNALTNEGKSHYNGRYVIMKKALTKTVKIIGNFQRAGVGVSPVKVQGPEHHFRAAG